MENKEILLKEIDLIQSCIKRMSQNSFWVKGCLFTILTLSIGFFQNTSISNDLYLILIVISCFFWYLDAYFLSIEKMYRWKYEWIIKNRSSTTEYSYDLNPYNSCTWSLKDNGKQKSKPCFFLVMFSRTLWPIYLTVNLILLYIIIW